MAKVRYTSISPADFDQLQAFAAMVMKWQKQVRPFGPDYDRILRIKADLNALAEGAGAPLPFPPTV